MSKSLGNVVDPLESLNKYTLDGMRYFLLREGVPDSDCNLSEQKFTKFTNVELANTLGNLYQRCLPFNKKSIYPSYKDLEAFFDEEDKKLISKLNDCRKECDQHFSSFNFYLGIQSIMACLRMTNNMVQEYKPWILVKSQTQTDIDKLKKMIYLVYETLRISSILLQPIVPDLASEVLNRLSVDKNDRSYNHAILNLESENKLLSDLKKTTLFKRL